MPSLRPRKPSVQRQTSGCATPRPRPEELPAQRRYPRPRHLSVWDYAMIGCFFGKKMKQLQSINHRELIKFEDSYKLCHDYFPSPAVDEAFLRQRHFIVRAHFFSFSIFLAHVFWRAMRPVLASPKWREKHPALPSTPLLISRFQASDNTPPFY